ncbi:hypothetical protein D556_2186 [Bordetella holmesii 41130]|nr:hypothetical protein D556_2186 [Bordetella holmesii 41130]
MLTARLEAVVEEASAASIADEVLPVDLVIVASVVVATRWGLVHRAPDGAGWRVKRVGQAETASPRWARIRPYSPGSFPLALGPGNRPSRSFIHDYPARTSGTLSLPATGGAKRGPRPSSLAIRTQRPTSMPPAGRT